MIIFESNQGRIKFELTNVYNANGVIAVVDMKSKFSMDSISKLLPDNVKSILCGINDGSPNDMGELSYVSGYIENNPFEFLAKKLLDDSVKFQAEVKPFETQKSEIEGISLR